MIQNAAGLAGLTDESPRRFAHPMQVEVAVEHDRGPVEGAKQRTRHVRRAALQHEVPVGRRVQEAHVIIRGQRADGPRRVRAAAALESVYYSRPGTPSLESLP